MKILYIGDIMGKAGRKTVQKLLPDLIIETSADFVIAQGENLSNGKGMQLTAIADMQAAGIDFFTGGNWTTKRPEVFPILEDTKGPVTRPANYPEGTPGRRYKIAETPYGRILIVSLLGQIVGAFPAVVDNPLKVIDAILEETKNEQLIARIVNFHGDFSSEKLVIGQYLDGRVTAAIGDHWHIPTADGMIFPKGTAHITDVGMTGSLESCLGVKTEVIIKRWLSDQSSRNELEDGGRMQLCAFIIDVDTQTGLAKTAQQYIKYYQA